ncbi:MAG: 5-formyltetrahydrofolate cyclo-ligase [Chlorobium sp.]
MDRDGTIARKKADLRAVMMAGRLSVPDTLRGEMNREIAAHLLALPELLTARHIHLYLSWRALAEVDTEPVLEALAVMNKRLSVPFVRSGDICSARYHPGDGLRVTPSGYPEPAVYAEADESDLDLVVVPLLSFDAKGYRLGYGKGMYDRFFCRLSRSGVTPFRLGVSYLQQRCDALPLDPWDEPLDGIIHQAGIIRYT